MSKQLGIGLTGTGWVAEVHAHAFNALPEARLVAVASRDEQRGQAFAARNSIDTAYTDYSAMLDDPKVDVVVVGVPNHLHAEITIAAAAAKKHVICEKPLAVSLEQGEQMIRACKDSGVMLALAEELCFVPKFCRARTITESGALGRVFQVHQREAHDGPHSPWFFTRDEAGGGALMDMGCHSIELARWVMGRPRAIAVYAQLANHLHPDSVLEDHAVLMVEFEGGATAVLESGWALKGGMVSELNLQGTKGVLYTDLLRGTGMRMFSETGVDGEPFDSIGWTTPDQDWLWNNGYPQEMRHFLECARNGTEPEVGGEDGMAQLEIIHAAYHSAASKTRVELPFRPKGVQRAVDLWLGKR